MPAAGVAPVSYTALAVLAVLLAGAADLVVLRTAVLRRPAFWTAYAILFGFQLLVNGVLTGLPVVVYAPSAILGPRLVHAPVEDLLFGFAMIVVTLALWVRLGEHAPRGAGRPGRPPRAG